MPSGTVTPAAGGGGSTPDILKQVVTLSAAQILTLNTAPTTVVAAPGAGKMLVPLEWTVSFHAGGIPYATNTAVQLMAGPGPWSGAQRFGFQGVLDGASVVIIDDNVSASGASADYNNLALVLGNDTGNPTAGNGTLTATIVYYVATL